VIHPEPLASAAVAAADEAIAPATAPLLKAAHPKEMLPKGATTKEAAAERAADPSKAIGLRKETDRRRVTVARKARVVASRAGRVAELRVRGVAANRAVAARVVASKVAVSRVVVRGVVADRAVADRAVADRVARGRVARGRVARGRVAPETVRPATARSPASRPIPMTISTAAKPMFGSIRRTNSTTTICTRKIFTRKTSTTI